MGKVVVTVAEVMVVAMEVGMEVEEKAVEETEPIRV